MPPPSEEPTLEGLVWEGAPVAEIAERFSSPFFLVSEGALLRNFTSIRDSLAAAGVPVIVRYCAKTNNELGVLRPLAAAGSHVLTSHLAELELAEEAGFPSERIACQRPVFEDGELRRILDRSPSLIHLYRESDIEQFESAARASGRRIPVSVRLRNPTHLPSPLTALSRRLGVPSEDVVRVARRIASSDALSLAGVNTYIGTQQSRAGAWASVLRALGGIVQTLERDGIAVTEVNLGGGIPSPSLRRPGPFGLLARWRDVPPEEPPETVERFCSGLARLYGEHVLDGLRGERPALAVEPGRGIVGNAAVLVAKVMAVQGGWLFLDCSRNSLGESALLFHRRILPVTRSAGEERYWNLSGNTLNTLDVVDVHRRLPTPGRGDLLALFDAGAYSISRATRYAGLSPAVLILGRDGSVSCIREEETGADLTARMVSRAAGDE